MSPALIIILPLLFLLIVVLYGVIYTILRAWLDYRVRIAFLRQLDGNPALLDSIDEITPLLKDEQRDSTRFSPRQNYAITGLLLAVIGIALILFGQSIRFGDFAVGSYLAGYAGLFIGGVLALLGLAGQILIRLSARPVSAKPSDANKSPQA